ncbi:Cytochrome P450 monooxygenase aflN [Apiospora hydei]|uniref:Cytochrome P450 monooxygenase aflN n=1 Tax=Apiospora hydei TaxID=1337664 RepID=A0ABR1W8C3_9PEZI
MSCISAAAVEHRSRWSLTTSFASQPIAQPHSLLWGHLPLLANLRKKFPKDAHHAEPIIEMFENWQEYFPGAKQCPPFVLLDLWPVRKAMFRVSDPKLSQHFTTEKLAPRGETSRHFMTPISLGLDLISADVPTHRVWRSRFAPGFLPRNLLTHMPALLEEIGVFVSKVEARAGKAGGPWGKLFQLEDWATSLTFDVIARVAIDVKLGEQLVDGPGPFRDALQTQILQMKPRSLLNRGWKNHRTMAELLKPKVQARIAAMGNTKTVHDDKTVIDLVFKRYQENCARKGEPVTPDKLFVETIMSNLKVFIFAGHDTTSSTICFSLYELSRHPEILAKVRQEHDEVFGADPLAAPAQLLEHPHKINETPYTLAVIKETLRMYPLAGSFREGTSKTVLHAEEGGAPVSAEGFDLIDGVWELHYRPDLWPRPREFLPDRWLMSEGDPLFPIPHAWRAFEHGPMNCIGKDLALLEVRLVLVHVARRYDFETAWDEWDAIQGNKEPHIDRLRGDRAYRGMREGGLSKPKDGLPVHVRHSSYSK